MKYLDRLTRGPPPPLSLLLFLPHQPHVSAGSCHCLSCSRLTSVIMKVKEGLTLDFLQVLFFCFFFFLTQRNVKKQQTPFLRGKHEGHDQKLSNYRFRCINALIFSCMPPPTDLSNYSSKWHGELVARLPTGSFHRLVEIKVFPSADDFLASAFNCHVCATVTLTLG